MSRHTPSTDDGGLRHASAAALAAALLFGAVSIAYGETVIGLVRQWSTDDDYSHGFAIVPLALFFAWRRREALRRTPVRPSAWGLPALVFALALLVVGRTAGELFLSRVSLVALVVAGVIFLLGTAHVRILAFPLGFLLLMVPLPALVFNQIAMPLQELASTAGETALRTGGVPVLRHGNVLELAAVRLEVAEACSGIRSLMTLLTFSLVLGQLGPPSRWRPLVLAAFTVPVAIAANGARVAATGFAAHAWGPAAVRDDTHTAAGLAVFLAVVGCLLVMERLMTARQRPAAGGAA